MSSWIKFKILWKSSIILKLREFRRTKMVYTAVSPKIMLFLGVCLLLNQTNQTNNFNEKINKAE